MSDTLKLARDARGHLWLTKHDVAAIHLSDDELRWIHQIAPLLLDPVPKPKNDEVISDE